MSNPEGQAGRLADSPPATAFEKPAGSPKPRRAMTTGRAWRALRWSVAVAFVSCAAFVLALEIQHRAGHQHFSYTLGVPLLALLAGASLVMMIMSSWLLARGPHRVRAAVWGIVGLLPAAVWTTIGLYAHSNWQRRYVPRDYLMDLSRRAGATIMEAELAVRYPHKLEGRRVIMFHHENLARPQEDLARMEAFLGGLERHYGRQVRTPIHWARGTAAGQRGVSLYGLALGSATDPPPLVSTLQGAAASPARSSDAPAAPPRAAPELQAIDRHEAAHAVMSQWMPPDAEPPTLLSEGWAEAIAHAGPPPHPLDLTYHPLPPPGQILPTLMGPDHYHQNSGPVYPVGWCLVRFLLDQHGHEKFFELYRTIRPHNVAGRFVEIYGVDLESVEREMLKQTLRGAINLYFVGRR